MASFPSLSTDQVAAFVELAGQGSLRRAAGVLHITEQGIRNRLLALEGRLGVELYRKSRGPRRAQPLTEQGRQFLPHAVAFLDRARQLGELFAGAAEPHELHVAATQYLILYVLIDVVRRFHQAFPHIRVRLSNHTEQEIEEALVQDPELTLGVAAPYESSPELEYVHLFSLDWSLITPRRHRLLRKPALRLRDLADVPLILFERGSTGRQHVMDAFHGQGLSPRVDTETTNTEIIVRMVEAGLGVSVVPLIPGGVVTRGHRVGVRGLGDQIRPIHSGILVRRGERLPAAAQALVNFLRPGSKASAAD
ncbi:MAG TPA: LysR family transcriptional regulator [Gemmataceae bacterium]|jgi:DNA-binding transcriptional LysR family regulator|nr:LysR family transcriptional regulator [Gemmataceae bacterium]